MTLPAIIGLSGQTLGRDEAAMLARHRPCGVILFARNVGPPDQLRALTGSIRSVLPDAAIMIDQEGGRVARLRPPAWHGHPPAETIGRLALANDAAGQRAAWITGALIGTDCAEAGITIAAAPVLDLRVPGADAVIGDRAYGSDPALVARLAGALADGLRAAGVQPVGKHAPGHGAAGADSHLALPVVASIDDAALVPFASLARTIGWMMTAHVLYRDADPDRCATLSPGIISDVIRGRIGFDGVLVSDDLAMGAVSGDPGARARECLAAGCDIALECSGQIETSLDVLGGLPQMPERSRARLERASDAVRRARRPLDAQALAQERAALLG